MPRFLKSDRGYQKVSEQLQKGATLADRIFSDVLAVNAAKAEAASFNSTSLSEEYTIDCDYYESSGE